MRSNHDGGTVIGGLATLLVLASLILLPLPLRAAEVEGLNSQLFAPNADGLGYFTTESARTGQLGKIIFNAHLNYATGVVGLWNGDELQSWAVRRQLGVDLQIGLGFHVADLVMRIPFAPYQEGSGVSGHEFSMHTFGDVSVHPKVQILNPDVRTIGVAVAMPISFPSGNSSALYGNPGVTVAPTAIGELRVGVLDVGLNLGVVGRKTVGLQGLDVGPQFLYRLAARIRPLPALGLQAELWGFAGGNVAASPANWLGGINVSTPTGFVFRAGVGTGIGAGFGAPKVRLVVGIGACTPAQKLLDADGDEIRDRDDLCPDEPEDIDGWQDTDGCPDPDDDGDGVPDTHDECPEEKENKNGIEDDDGCPDESPDADADGIFDEWDACPTEPEDVDGFEDTDGCPDGDDDGDGIVEPDDDCPDEPETVNGVADDDGCPDSALAELDWESSHIVLSRPILFFAGGANLDADAFAVLNAVADVLLAHKNLVSVEIQAHCSERDSATSNQVLSQRRGDVVATYLANRGVDPDRVKVVGYGNTRPADDTDQRIELRVSVVGE